MAADFYAGGYSFRRMDFSEVKELEVGDIIHVCINMDFPSKMEFIKATVVRPLFWNSDADEPGWELETDNCFADAYSIYEVKQI